MKRFVGRKRRINGYDIAMMAVLLVFALMALYPFLFTLAGSLNDAQDYQYGGVWLIPRKFTWASYIVILKDERLYRALFNTLIVTLVSVVVSLLFTSMVAYAMSRKKLKGSRVFWFLNMVPMFISGGMIPSYMLILMTGLFNTYFVYIIPTMFSVFNMIVLCNFFRGIDNSLWESAVLDGAGEFRIWFSIYLPLSKPALATIGLWIAVGKWNTYMSTLLWTETSNSDLWLLQFYLMRLIREGELPSGNSAYYGEVSAQTLSFAAIVVSTIPIVCIYPFISKHFSKGIMLGSIKG